MLYGLFTAWKGHDSARRQNRFGQFTWIIQRWSGDPYHLYPYDTEMFVSERWRLRTSLQSKRLLQKSRSDRKRPPTNNKHTLTFYGVSVSFISFLPHPPKMDHSHSFDCLFFFLFIIALFLDMKFIIPTWYKSSLNAILEELYHISDEQATAAEACSSSSDANQFQAPYFNNIVNMINKLYLFDEWLNFRTVFFSVRMFLFP